MINNEIYGNIKKLVKGKKLNSRKPLEIDAYFEKCPFCNNIILKNPVKEKSCPICFNEIFDEESYEFSMTLPDNRKLSSIRVFDFIRDIYKLDFFYEGGFTEGYNNKNQTILKISLYNCYYIKLCEGKDNSILYVGFKTDDGIFNDSILVKNKELDKAKIVLNKLSEYHRNINKIC